MSTQTIQTAGVAAMPSVNLMPPEIAEAARFRKLQVAMAGAVIASVVIVGVLYTQSKHGVTDAQKSLTAAQAKNTALQTNLTSLASVQQTYANVQAKQQLLQTAMGPEIRWSYILNDLSYLVPSNLWLTGVTATEVGVGTTGAAPSTTDPGAIGNITFNGTAGKHDDVAAFLDALAKEKGFTNPSFSHSLETSIDTHPVVNYTAAVDLDSAALSNRYVKGAN